MLVCDRVDTGVELTEMGEETKRLREDGLMQSKMVVDGSEAGS